MPFDGDLDLRGRRAKLPTAMGSSSSGQKLREPEDHRSMQNTCNCPLIGCASRGGEDQAVWWGVVAHKPRSSSPPRRIPRPITAPYRVLVATCMMLSPNVRAARMPSWFISDPLSRSIAHTSWNSFIMLSAWSFQQIPSCQLMKSAGSGEAVMYQYTPTFDRRSKMFGRC